LFRSVFGIFTKAFANNGGFESGIRIIGIFNNPNIYAGIMAIAVFLSLYLTFHASDRKDALISAALLAVNSLSYLLAFSMGSLLFFMISCLVMMEFQKRSASSLFLLMLKLRSSLLSLLFFHGGPRENRATFLHPRNRTDFECDPFISVGSAVCGHF
jgi:O-antigen ligase